ncbi:transposase [Streptomyces sp. NPDC051445]|uniref:transposase n=1 Tax=Streptomyces sp. NPDC051445 TaxID=3365653 RepID=UPI0037AAAACB
MPVGNAADWPTARPKKIQSTNPLERINREVERRTDFVQVFPDDDALLRLVTAVLFEPTNGSPSPAATYLKAA